MRHDGEPHRLPMKEVVVAGVGLLYECVCGHDGRGCDAMQREMQMHMDAGVRRVWWSPMGRVGGWWVERGVVMAFRGSLFVLEAMLKMARL